MSLVRNTITDVQAIFPVIHDTVRPNKNTFSTMLGLYYIRLNKFRAPKFRK